MRLRYVLVFTLVLLFSAGSSAQLLVDNFEGVADSSLLNAGWTLGNSTTNPLVYSSTGLTLAGYPGSGVGNAVTLATSGQDIYKTFEPATSGYLYTSFMMNVDTAQSGDYFLAMSNESGPTFNAATRVWVKDASGAGYVVGVSKSSSDASTTPTYGTTVYPYDSTVAVVIKYEFKEGSSNDSLTVYVVQGSFPSTEPTTAEVGHNGSLKSDPSDVAAILIRQGSNTSAPTLTLDGFHVRNSWPRSTGQAKITFMLNTSTIADTIQSSNRVEVRGGTRPLTWGDDTPDMSHLGGDYWSITHRFDVGDTIQYKYYVAHSGEAWEGGDNKTLGIAGDTVLPVAYFNKGNTPPFTPTDSIDVWFRVNMQSQESFNPSTDQVDVRGSFNGWAAGTDLNREGVSFFYSGQARIPDTAGVGPIEYKFVYVKAGNANWESVNNRMATVTKDTTLYWVWWDNNTYNPPAVEDTVVMTFTANLSRAISERGFAIGDTLEVRTGFNSTAAAVRPKRMVRQGLTTLYTATDTVVTSIGNELAYQYYLIKGGEQREVYFNFDFADPTNNAAERRRIGVTGNTMTIRDTATAEIDSRRSPRFQNTQKLSKAVTVTYTVDVRPAIYTLLRGKSLVATNRVAYVISNADSILTYGVYMNGPAVGGWDQSYNAWGGGAVVNDSVRMRDDGTHGDVTAGDSIFTMQWSYTTADNIGQVYKFGIGSYDNEGGFGNNHVANIDDSGPTATIHTQFGSIDPKFFDGWDYDNARPSTVTSVKESESIPTVFSLEQNYPNPFNPATTIEFGLPMESDVTMRVYNTLGQQVGTVVSGKLRAGVHQVTFDASHLSTGVYFYQITAGDFTSLKKMVLVK